MTKEAHIRRALDHLQRAEANANGRDEAEDSHELRQLTDATTMRAVLAIAHLLAAQAEIGP